MKNTCVVDFPIFISDKYLTHVNVKYLSIVFDMLFTNIYLIFFMYQL